MKTLTFLYPNALKNEKRIDPDVIRTRSLLIWSQTRYHCATESAYGTMPDIGKIHHNLKKAFLLLWNGQVLRCFKTDRLL